ncbi:MAG: DUF2188 domain-containing protein [Candidatus Izemoplasmatales bacterium]
MSSTSSVHVIPRTQGWAVTLKGADRALKIHATKDAAVRHALEYATRHSVNLFIHMKSGAIVASFAIDTLKLASALVQCIDMLHQDGENTKKAVRETLQNILGID